MEKEISIPTFNDTLEGLEDTNKDEFQLIKNISLEVDSPIKQSENPTLDEVLQSIGYKFQVFMFLTILSGMLSGVFILYSLYYFQLQPEYLCKIGGKWDRCTKNEVCKGN
jgi:hypothetical protein